MWVTIVVQKITKTSCEHTCLILPLRKDPVTWRPASVKLPLENGEGETHNFRWRKIRARERDRAEVRSRNYMLRIHINPTRHGGHLQSQDGQAEGAISGSGWGVGLARLVRWESFGFRKRTFIKKYEQSDKINFRPLGTHMGMHAHGFASSPTYMCKK